MHAVSLVPAFFRQYAMVLGYSHTDSLNQVSVFLFFHRGGLTSSCALDSQEDQHDILRFFLAILSWQTPAHAGLPMWCNDGEMILPVTKAVCSWRRFCTTLFVFVPEWFPFIPAESTSFGGPRRYVRLKDMTNSESASELPPLAEGVEVHRGL